MVAFSSMSRTIVTPSVRSIVLQNSPASLASKSSFSADSWKTWAPHLWLLWIVWMDSKSKSLSEDSKRTSTAVMNDRWESNDSRITHRMRLSSERNSRTQNHHQRNTNIFSLNILICRRRAWKETKGAAQKVRLCTISTHCSVHLWTAPPSWRTSRSQNVTWKAAMLGVFSTAVA